MWSIANAYIDAGLSIIPIERTRKWPHRYALETTTGRTGVAAHYGPAHPDAAWRVYSERMPTWEETMDWFGFGTAERQALNIGIVCGAVSGGLVVIDFESPACWPTWTRLLTRAGLANLAAACLVVQTSKGHHVYFRMPSPPGHRILSSHGSGPDTLVLAETQGQGCYVVAPPSVLVDPPPAWAAYTIVQGDYLTIPTVTQDQGQQLLQAATFPDLWATRLPDPHAPAFNNQLALSRGGMALSNQHRSLYLDWSQLRALRTYFATYGDLLDAVEHAPPPPPSYPDEEEGNDDHA